MPQFMFERTIFFLTDDFIKVFQNSDFVINNKIDSQKRIGPSMELSAHN